jgi:hypothetical protein
VKKLEAIVKKLNFSLLVMICLTFGLAPFRPPHLYEKLNMLVHGELVKAIDWFDMFFHGTPWVLLALKIYLTLRERNRSRRTVDSPINEE